MATYIKTLVDKDGNTVLPKTRSSAVYMSDNSTLESKISSLNNTINGKANTSHVHDASNITSGVVPLIRGGTGFGNAYRARASLARYSITGSKEKPVNGWWLCGTVNFNVGYQTYCLRLAYTLTANMGSGFLDIMLRTEATAGVLNLNISHIWLTPFGGALDASRFCIDATDPSNMKLYFQITSTWCVISFNVVHETNFSEDISYPVFESRCFRMINHYLATPVEGENYTVNPTKTLVGVYPDGGRPITISTSTPSSLRNNEIRLVYQ